MNSVLVIAVLVVEVLVLLVLVVVMLYAMFQLYCMHIAPFVPSKKSAIDVMLDLGGVTQGMRIVDLGSGMGDICFAAAQRGAHATGVELNPVLVVMSKISAFFRHESRVQFVCADLFRYTLPKETDVVMLYLFPQTVQRVWNKLITELPSGTKIVTNAFVLPTVPVAAKRDSVFVYLIP